MRPAQRIAKRKHGFRGPLGPARAEAEGPLVADRMLPTIDAVMPMPDMATMLALIDRLAA